jgi:hypothetical protein
MRKEEVPQDDENLLQGKFKKLMYATDGSEHYTEIGSVGWEAENVVLQQAWEEINEKVEDARRKVLSGEASILLYHMEKNLMDPSILSGYVGVPAFLVKLHMKPFFFSKLSKKTLEKYAYAFRMPVDEMLDVDRIKKPTA